MKPSQPELRVRHDNFGPGNLLMGLERQNYRMRIKSNIFLSVLAILLLAILNIIFLSIFDITRQLLYNNYNIWVNAIVSLIITALGVSLISYWLINKISTNYGIIQDRNNIGKELKKALLDVRKANKEMRLEIADRKKIENTLIESENQIRTIIQKAPTGIALFDKEGYILECNPALQEMLGYDHNELSGVLFSQAIHPNDVALYKNKFKELIDGNSDIYRIDTRYIHREFREVWGSLSASVVRDGAGQPQFVIAMVEDITLKQQAEEKIVNYQKQLQSLTSELSLIEERERRRLATNLHDHVGQVLTLVGNKIDELHEVASADTCDSLIEEIRKLVGQTIKCIRSLIFELSPPILYDLGLEEAIEWLADHFSQEYGLEIQVDKDEQPKPLKTEGNVILFQAVRELLLNITKHAKATSVKIYIQRACNDLRIIVEDDGVGFENNLIDHEQHKIKGFGLFSIHERLEYYGGSMIIKSNESEGTKITLLMPMIPSKREECYNILKQDSIQTVKSKVTEIFRTA
jgi:PAS domain S-box-containing protein